MAAGNPTHELSAPPPLAAQYIKAALTGVLHRGDSLPDTSYSLAPQRIDAGHLAGYQRVCGFPVTDVLPPTYLHVLAFPLSMALMNEPAFPFPLVGLVHVANEITVRRPARAGEAVAFEVRAADLREHPAGRQFDVLATASVDGEPVWDARSTYLRRGKQPERRDRTDRGRESRPEPRAAVAQVRVPGDIGRRYAAVSGDRNPIHLHPLTAKAFGFPSAIAHGMWLKARALATLQGRLPDAVTAQVSFKLPVLLPATIAVAAEPAEGGWSLDVRSASSGKPHLSGTVRTP